MSKYEFANAAIEHAVEQGMNEGWDRKEMLLTMIVASVAAYRSEAGRDSTREALRYELAEVEGAVATQFIRSR